MKPSLRYKKQNLPYSQKDFPKKKKKGDYAARKKKTKQKHLNWYKGEGGFIC